MSTTYKYVDISSRKHGLDNQAETVVFEVAASSISEADSLFLEKKGSHPSRIPNLVLQFS